MMVRVIIFVIIALVIPLTSAFDYSFPEESGFIKDWKLLLSEKSCEAIEYHPNISRSALACEEDKIHLNCSDNPENVIIVCEAMFGRDNLDQCGPVRSLNDRCFSLDAINVVLEKCQWRSTCQIDATIHEFADPCPEQSKFLRVKYICLNKLYAASLVTTTTTTITPGLSTSGTGLTQPGQPKKQCPRTENRGISWPRTNAAEFSLMPCPNIKERPGNATHRNARFARYLCGPDGTWYARPDLSQCESFVGVEMKKITDELATGEKKPVDAAKEVEERTTSEKMYFGGDLILTIDAIHKTANATAKSQNPQLQSVNEVAKSLTRSGSAILADEQFPIWGDLPEFKQDVAATKLLDGIEQSMMADAEAKRTDSATSVSDGTTVFVENNIIAEVAIVNVGKLEGQKSKEFPMELKKQKNRGQGNDKVKIFIDDSESVVMPTSQLKKYSENGMAKVVYIQYRNLERLMGYSAELPLFNDSFSNRPGIGNSGSGIGPDDIANFDFPAVGDSDTHALLNSRVVTISMGDRRMKLELDEPVIFTLRHEKKTESGANKCCFWDYDPITYQGGWSAEGCYRVQTNNTHTTCQCNHLTSFAILVDLAEQTDEADEIDKVVQSWITIIGCAISSVCLVLFWFTFQFVDRKLDVDQRMVHKHLAICLLLGEILFVAGIDKASINAVACNIVAALLQFFFTAAFLWMLFEGIQIATKLNELVPSSTRKWPFYCVAAYGTSSLLVGLTAGLSGLEAYGKQETCWLRGVWLLFFVVPVGLIILINVFILCYLIFKACYLVRQQASSEQFVCATGKESKLYQTRSTIKGITAATILLGLTWSFGFLYVNNRHFIIAAYLFTIFNSLQGFLIFLFFCVFNKWVRRQYSVWFRKHCCACSYTHSSSASSNKHSSEPSSSCCFPTPTRSPKRDYYYHQVTTGQTPAPGANTSSGDQQTSLSQQSATVTASSSSNQNIIVRMLNRFTPVEQTKSNSQTSPDQQLLSLQDQKEQPMVASEEKSPLPDLTPGKFTGQIPLPDSKSASQISLNGESNFTADDMSQKSQQIKASKSSALVVVEKPTTKHADFTSCNTENVTDYMQQVFLTSDSCVDGKALRDFDQAFVVTSPQPSGVIPPTLAIPEEDTEHTQLLATPPQSREDDELVLTPTRTFPSKSKTFSDFLSVLVKQHEEGLIDEDTAHAHNRMFVSRIFDNDDDNSSEDYIHLTAGPTEPENSGICSPVSSASSVSVSQMPDIYAPLDDLHINVSTASLSHDRTKANEQNDSGFCSNRLAADLLNSKAAEKFPARKISRTHSDGDVTAAEAHQHCGANDNAGFDNSPENMFDDYDGEQLLLIDTSAPSRVRSLTQLLSS